MKKTLISLFAATAALIGGLHATQPRAAMAADFYVCEDTQNVVVVGTLLGDQKVCVAPPHPPGQ